MPIPYLVYTLYVDVYIYESYIACKYANYNYIRQNV